MKLVYFGTAEFAVPALVTMAPWVDLVVTQPDRPGGRGMSLRASPVKVAALDLGLRVETPERARAPEFVADVEALRPDALLVAAYGQILSQRLLDSATRGGINLHGSILPKYRGAAPIQRSIQNGDVETGVALMQMDKGMDTGDIIAIERLEIGPDDTAREVALALAELAARMAQNWMPKIVAGPYPRSPQHDEQATIAPKVDKAEAELSFVRDAAKEYNRFRAFSPSPGPFLRTKFGLVKISQARLGTNVGSPGVVLSASASCEIAFRNGSLHLLEVQPEGKKRMTGKDFANGLRLMPGDTLLP